MISRGCGGFESEEVDGAIWGVMGSDGDGIVLLGKERFAVVFEEDVVGRSSLGIQRRFHGIGISIELWVSGVGSSSKMVREELRACSRGSMRKRFCP